ncbi:E3 ubiquitin-protein ligase Kcmf1 [Drosophila gunungcola]|nr:E3 ubiquitin-protein ligase Kcmf1 [Drosophila gunungcola]
MNRHEGVVCKGCGKESFMGRCYRCLSCRDFSMCMECYNADFTTAEHPFDHPVKCIYTQADVELYFGGEYISGDPPQSYRCPYCKQWGFTESSFLEHVSTMHPNASTLLVSTMVTLFEQQEASRLFLEDEQLASISAAATSRNQQMRRSVGTLDLYLERLNPDGSYQRTAGRNEEGPAFKASEVVARDRAHRGGRRSAQSIGRSGSSSRILARPSPPTAAVVEANSRNNHPTDNETTMSLGEEAFYNNGNARVALLRRVSAGRNHRSSTSESLVPPALGVTAQQVLAPSSSAAVPITHPSLIEMMRFYGGNLQIEPGTSPSGRAIRAWASNSAARTTSNNRTVNVYGPSSHISQAPHNARSFPVAPESNSREDRRRAARMSGIQGSGGGALQRLGSNPRALATRNVEFSDLLAVDSDLVSLSASSVENLRRCLNEEPPAVVKLRDQEGKRYLCHRFLSSRTSMRPKNTFLVLRAEFVAQLLSSALCEEDFEGISFAVVANTNPKVKAISSSNIAGAGDAEKIPPP